MWMLNFRAKEVIQMKRENAELYPQPWRKKRYFTKL